MMRSLWSGVSGLDAHQVAMDVEGNNIANVNTVGFKYSRTNFQDLLAQTVKASTAPQGNLGGKNSMQVGLGANVSSVETMFKQGSIQNTDKNTDMAISGDGFFVVTGDNGKTSRYTRAGDFSFDSNGNFVDPNGYKVEGWMADPGTYKIDSASGIKPISIPPGLTTPAHATSEISIKANLNSGDTIKEMSPANTTLLPTNDLNGTYTATGEKIALTEDMDKFKFVLTKADGTEDTVTLTYGPSTSDTDGKFTTIKDLLDDINYYIKDTTGEKRYKVYLNGDGQIVDNNNAVQFDTTSNTSKLAEVLKALNGPSTASTSIKHTRNAFIGSDDVGELFDANGNALNLEDGQGITANIEGLGENRKFIYSSTPITQSAGCSSLNGSYQTPDNIKIADSNEGMHWTYDSNNARAYFNTNQQVTLTFSNGSTHSYTYGKDFQTIADLCCLANKDLSDANINDILTFSSDGKIIESDGNGITNVSVQDSNGNTVTDTTTGLGAMGKILDGLDGTNSQTNIIQKNDIYYFHDINDLELLWQTAINDSGDPLNSTTANSGIVTLNKDGKLSITNTSASSFNISIAGYPDDEHDNQKLTDTFSAINGTLAAGGTSLTQAFEAATHTTSLDIFDSLGSKHTLTIHYRKTHTSDNPNDPTVWKWYADVPEPSSLDNPANGYAKFNPDGSLNSFNPASLIFNANNGSDPGQAVQLDFGELNGFGGLTSFDAPSSTSGQTQDGYPGGDLQNLTVDQTGTIIGVFTNGRSYSLAQVALAKFVNNEGLMHDGGSLYSASANSGDPIVGTAGTGGRGTIQPSALEMSNVDLSRSLTELIVIQRGYQANAKTITTSDQMLQTLLNLKQ
jgi:flagellar hook protein FlgE